MANAFKAAWLEHSGSGVTMKKLRSRKKRTVRHTVQQSHYQVARDMVIRQAVETTVLRAGYRMSGYMAVANVGGKTGIALRVTGKIGLRAVPIVGAALLARDMHTVYKLLKD